MQDLPNAVPNEATSYYKQPGQSCFREQQVRRKINRQLKKKHYGDNPLLPETNLQSHWKRVQTALLFPYRLSVSCVRRKTLSKYLDDTCQDAPAGWLRHPGLSQ